MSRRLTLASALCVLLLPVAATAAVFTVGPGGSHATIQAALDTAASTAGDDEIRVATGTYTETPFFGSNVAENTVLDGGWDATFTTRSDDPALTVVDAASAGHALRLEPFGGSVTVRNFTFMRGAFFLSAGAVVIGHGDAQVTLEDCVIRDSLASSLGGISGGGLGVGARDTSQVSIRRCVIRDNAVTSLDSQASGGGISASASNSGVLQLESLQVLDNTVTGVTHAFGGGIVMYVYDTASITLGDMHIEGNTVASQAYAGASGVQIENDPVGGSGGATIVMRRSAIVGNIAAGAFGAGQLDVRVSGSNGGVLLGDALVADSLGADGIDAYVVPGGRLQLVNVTAAGNAGTDLSVSGDAHIRNSLADTTQLSLDAVLDHNLFDVDPGYVDRAGGDYRLTLASPAVGAGSMTPDGGLGATDLDGNARVIGPRVDLGAYEADDPTLFFDGFEP